MSILEVYHLAFALSKRELSRTPIAKHKIRMKVDALPRRHKSYRCSPKEYEFMQKEIDMLLELDCIERYEATWVMPVVMVKKKDTTDLRICIDYTSLNLEMLIEKYPISRIDEILIKLGIGIYFSKLDIKSSFQ